MIATLILMPAEDTTLAAPPSPRQDGEAHSAQVAAEEAKASERRLEAASKAVQEADGKLIEHVLKK